MSKPTLKLGVNIDHVATLRQSRRTHYPDPLAAAAIATEAGADSITVHLREDRRHIQDGDVIALRQRLSVPLNLELAATEAMIDFAARIQPAYCCLVPERRAELTTEGGLDMAARLPRIRAAVERLQQAGCRVSLFIAADKAQIDAAVEAGADMIEIHTGGYAQASTAATRAAALAEIGEAVDHALRCGLQVNAGHGLNYENVQPIAAVPGIAELNIGHAIIARAVFVGLAGAVQEMIKLMRAARA